MKIKCDVIEDLLPLYIDGVCSEESKRLVEEHINECEQCCNKFDAQNSNITIDDDVIRENLKSREPFKKIRKHQMIKLVSLFVCMAAVIAFFYSNLVWHFGAQRFIEKTYHKPVSIINNVEYLYKGKKYRIILSTAKGKKDELYLQCFEEKLWGLFYKPTYGASQGDSKSLYGMTLHFVQGSNNGFVVVYGYNKGLQASTYSVKNANSNEWINQDISNEEYFLHIYTDIVYPEIVFKDKQGNDIIGVFGGY